MFVLILAMLLVMVVSAVVVAYVVYPHRGEAMPYVPQLGRAMRRGVDSLPTLEDSQSR